MKDLTRFIKSILSTVILFLFVGCLCLKGQDIALNKKYTLFPVANFSSNPRIYSVLTDGKYWNGSYFWTRPTTLGWVKTPQVNITVDLGDIDEVGSVSFNTTQEVDSIFNIHFPDHIYIFLSDDSVNFSYAGDATHGFTNVPGSYTIHKFILDTIDAKARYVKFVVIPHGSFLFCDEITVEKKQGNKERNFSLHANSVDSTVDSLLALDFRNKYSSQIRSRNTKNSYRSPYIDARFISPWDTTGPYPVTDSKQNGPDSMHFIIPQGGVVYGALEIINTTGLKKDFDINSPFSRTNMDSLQLYNATFVPAPGYSMIPDALQQLNGSSVQVLSGNQKVIFFKIKGSKAGNTSAGILVHSGKYKKILHLLITTVHLENFNELRLNANVWFNDFHPMVVDRREIAFKDLQDHHINTLLIGPGYLSPLNNPSFPKLAFFLSEVHFAGKLLVSTGFSNPLVRQPDPTAPFLSETWKKQFITWYDSLLHLITKQGFTSSQVYFYPYDEVRGKNIRDFIDFARWTKSSVPELNLYATLTKATIDSTDEFNDLLPLLNVAQIASGSPIVLPKLPKHSGQIWVYENNGKSKSASPYSFYRLMAWDAFVKDVTGIGFWSYTGDPRIKKVTDVLRDIDMDYGLVYDGPGKSIISSRRWEAFSLGIEDFQVLYLYGKEFGISKAKALAKEVMAHPENIVLADKIKDQMLLSLASRNR